MDHYTHKHRQVNRAFKEDEQGTLERDSSAETCRNSLILWTFRMVSLILI